MFFCHHFYCVRIETHCRHRSTKFLTTQSDQSKRDILVGHVLNCFQKCKMKNFHWLLVKCIIWSTLNLMSHQNFQCDKRQQMSVYSVHVTPACNSITDICLPCSTLFASTWIHTYRFQTYGFWCNKNDIPRGMSGDTIGSSRQTSRERLWLLIMQYSWHSFQICWENTLHCR